MMRILSLTSPHDTGQDLSQFLKPVRFCNHVVEAIFFIVMTKAKPLFLGTLPKKDTSASNPPADAPMPTIGKSDFVASVLGTSLPEYLVLPFVLKCLYSFIRALHSNIILFQLLQIISIFSETTVNDIDIPYFITISEHKTEIITVYKQLKSQFSVL